MKKIIVKLKWNEPTQKWLMHQGDLLLYDFWNCGTVQSIFGKPDKSKINKFRITVEKMDTGKDYES